MFTRAVSTDAPTDTSGDRPRHEAKVTRYAPSRHCARQDLSRCYQESRYSSSPSLADIDEYPYAIIHGSRLNQWQDQ
jgi:hypothetical protein